MSYVAMGTKWVTAGILAVWVSTSEAVHFLVFFMALDFATGMIVGALDGRLSSEASFRGLAKKTLILLLIAATHAAARAVNVSYDLASMVASAYCISELISITENCHHTGVPIPKVLVEFLEKTKTSWSGPERRQTGKFYAGIERRDKVGRR